MSARDEQSVKQCCAALYGSELAHLLLGESFHPGGTSLTDRMGRFMELTSDCKVLDVAAGRGASALHVAQSFGCEVVGVDLSEENVKRATEEASRRGLASRVRFEIADAERLPFGAERFDAILCECAFCTFPNKQAAAGEFFRVLLPGGRLGFSDLTRSSGPLPQLDGLLSWIACVGDAQPAESYVETLQRANFTVARIEDHGRALTELVRQMQGKLLGAEIAVGLKKLDLPNVNFAEAQGFIRAALDAVQNGELGYVAMVAAKPH